jgi:hypothetical protein
MNQVRRLGLEGTFRSGSMRRVAFDRVVLKIATQQPAFV